MFIFYLYSTCLPASGSVQFNIGLQSFSAILMDLAILVLTICGLWRKGALKSAIGGALSGQCLWYCAGTFVCNIPAVVSHPFEVLLRPTSCDIQVFPILNLNGEYVLRFSCQCP